MAFKVPEKFRIKNGPMGSDSSFGNAGAFFVERLTPKRIVYQCIASDGMGWEHVSVSFPNRTPSWEDMCFIKDLFWDDPEDVVIQFHPAKSDYVNAHKNCLHLWRPIDQEMPIPDAIMVGPSNSTN